MAAKLKRREKSALEEIPGVGPSLAADLERLGVTRVAQLKKRSPQRLFDELCKLTKTKQDPCVLYVFRCAVYYVSNAQRDPEKLKWWNWKETNLKRAKS
jgi:hypothetical protein